MDTAQTAHMKDQFQTSFSSPSVFHNEAIHILHVTRSLEQQTLSKHWKVKFKKQTHTHQYIMLSFIFMKQSSTILIMVLVYSQIQLPRDDHDSKIGSVYYNESFHTLHVIRRLEQQPFTKRRNIKFIKHSRMRQNIVLSFVFMN